MISSRKNSLGQNGSVYFEKAYSHIQRKERFMHRNHLFTLIELLTVVAVIVILISLLLPALQKTRHKALMVQCIGHQKQLIQEIVAYATDNGGHFQNRETFSGQKNTWNMLGYWNRDATPNAKTKIIFCPVLPFYEAACKTTRGGTDGAVLLPNGTTTQSYLVTYSFVLGSTYDYFSDVMGPYTTTYGIWFDRMKQAARTVVLGDGCNGSPPDQTSFAQTPYVAEGGNMHNLGLRHMLKYCVIACGDGHVESAGVGALREKYINRVQIYGSGTNVYQTTYIW